MDFKTSLFMALRDTTFQKSFSKLKKIQFFKKAPYDL
jgi:hypothetical protein